MVVSVTAKPEIQARRESLIGRLIGDIRSPSMIFYRQSDHNISPLKFLIGSHFNCLNQLEESENGAFLKLLPRAHVSHAWSR